MGSYSCVFILFFKQKTAYEMRISDWSSDVCSSDLAVSADAGGQQAAAAGVRQADDLLPADDADAGGDPRHPADHHAAGPAGVPAPAGRRFAMEIGRASCRERGCQYVSLQVVRVSLKKKAHIRRTTKTQQMTK